ncbi:MAG: phenylalanine--tRNA ligase subunit beta, partial [Cryomorphaceae bacterium]
LVNMLEAVTLNRNHKNPDLQLFEFGQVYHREGDKTRESFNLALVMTGRRFPESWNNPGDEVSYFELRNMLDMFFQRLGLAQRCRFTHEPADYLAEGQSVLLDGQNLGYIGRVKGDICARFDIDQAVFFAELNWSMLLSKVGDGKVKVQPIPKFPVVRRDFSLLLDTAITFEQIEQLARKTEKKLLRAVELFDVYEGKNLPEGKKSYAVRFLLRSDERTLTDEIVDGIMERIRMGLENELGASLR